MERYTTHSPINQQIVVGKPVVSKDKGTGAIQWSDINDVRVISLVLKQGERVIAYVIVLFVVPLKRWSLSRGMG